MVVCAPCRSIFPSGSQTPCQASCARLSFQRQSPMPSHTRVFQVKRQAAVPHQAVQGLGFHAAASRQAAQLSGLQAVCCVVVGAALAAATFRLLQNWYSHRQSSWEALRTKGCQWVLGWLARAWSACQRGQQLDQKQSLQLLSKETVTQQLENVLAELQQLSIEGASVHRDQLTQSAAPGHRGIVRLVSRGAPSGSVTYSFDLSPNPFMLSHGGFWPLAGNPDTSLPHAKAISSALQHLSLNKDLLAQSCGREMHWVIFDHDLHRHLTMEADVDMSKLKSYRQLSAKEVQHIQQSLVQLPVKIVWVIAPASALSANMRLARQIGKATVDLPGMHTPESLDEWDEDIAAAARKELHDLCTSDVATSQKLDSV